MQLKGRMFIVGDGMSNDGSKNVYEVVGNVISKTGTMNYFHKYGVCMGGASDDYGMVCGSNYNDQTACETFDGVATFTPVKKTNVPHHSYGAFTSVETKILGKVTKIPVILGNQDAIESWDEHDNVWTVEATLELKEHTKYASAVGINNSVYLFGKGLTVRVL